MFSNGQKPRAGFPCPTGSGTRPLFCCRHPISVCNFHGTHHALRRAWNPLRIRHRQQFAGDVTGYRHARGHFRRRVLRNTSGDGTGPSAARLEDDLPQRTCGQQGAPGFSHAWWRRWVEGAALGAAMLGLAALGAKPARAQPRWGHLISSLTAEIDNQILKAGIVITCMHSKRQNVPWGH
jgi:hypothetical protein